MPHLSTGFIPFIVSVMVNVIARYRRRGQTEIRTTTNSNETLRNCGPEGFPCASNKYNLFCLFILYQALITRSLNSFSVNHNVTYCSTLPVLLPDVQSEHGMVSRIHSSVQSYGRTLQMKDRRRARRRYRT